MLTILSIFDITSLIRDILNVSNIGVLQFKLVVTDPENTFDWWSTKTFGTPLRLLKVIKVRCTF